MLNPMHNPAILAFREEAAGVLPEIPSPHSRSVNDTALLRQLRHCPTSLGVQSTLRMSQALEFRLGLGRTRP